MSDSLTVLYAQSLADAREEEEEPDLKNWNPLQEEFESNRNSYKINTDDPGVALVGYGELFRVFIV